MAITVSTNKKGYLSLSFKWDSGVVFDLPVGLVVSTSYRTCVIGKFICSNVTTWNEDAKKSEPTNISDSIAVASCNKKDSKYAKVTDYDKIICEHLEPWVDKIVT